MRAYWAANATAASRARLAVAAMTFAALASCAPRVKAPVETAPPPPPPPATEKPVEVKPGQEAHRIAILVPLSGANAPVGISLANAATLALVDTGKQGVRLTSYDTVAMGAAGAANRAIADGAQLILGPLLAGDAAAIRAVAEPKGVTMLSFSNDAAIASGKLMVLGYQPAQSIGRVVAFSTDKGMKRIAALVPQGVYGQRASVALTQSAQQHGASIVSLTTFQRSPAALPAAARKVTDYDARVKQAAGGEVPPVAFDSLLVAASGAIANAFAPHLTKFGAPVGGFLLMGTELWNTEPGLSKAPALNGAVFAAVPDARFASMAKRYSARFGGTPSRLASLSYDAMLLAVSVAGTSWKPGQPFPAQALADPQGFAGIDGIFRFRNNVAERGLEVRQVAPTGFVTVSPAPNAF